MLPERQISQAPEGLSDYIHTNYPTGQAEVEYVLGLAERAKEKNHYYHPVSGLMDRAAWKAEKDGISEVPAILEAIRFLETAVPEQDKKLTLKKYLEFLETGEITSAHKSANALRNDHLKKALALSEFIEKLGA